MHTSQGWVSMATGAGVPCLAQLFRCVKKSQVCDRVQVESRSDSVPHTVCFFSRRPWSAARLPKLLPHAPDAVARTRLIARHQIRAGSEMASEKAGILSVGDVVEVSHRETLESGALRMQFAAGWVSLEASNGAAILDAC